MGFPLDNPIFDFFYWLLNTAGIGGLTVGVIVVVAILAYVGALRWIAGGANVGEVETYAYPTPALHEHS
jgi:hypothetical protein